MNAPGTVAHPPARRTDEAALGAACTECRLDLTPDWQFCAHCTARLHTACARCGIPLPPAGSLRCGHCGLTLLGSLK